MLRILPRIAGALAVLAAAVASANETDARYREDRAACQGAEVQDRQACLREAGAARAEARANRLRDPDTDFARNLVARCDHQPPADREDCLRRMRGEGTVSGSVAGGGVMRELRRPVTE